MPIFFDHHQGTQDSSQRSQDRKSIIAGLKAGRLGVRLIDGFHTANEIWCLTEAPSAQAVQQFHETRGVKLAAGDVSEVIRAD